MAWVRPTTTVEAYVSGAWADISADLTSDPIVLSYGIKDANPSARCAPTGTGKFGLRNGADNSASTIGYYSPFHASKRSGWGLSIPVRIKQVYGAHTRYFRGRLTQAKASPGLYEDRKVYCVFVDWMDESARTSAPAAIQENKRTDEIVSAVLAAMPVAPINTSIGVSTDTLAFALDKVPVTEKALTTFGDFARSEVGYVFCKRDATDGQTFVFEPRTTRVGLTTVLVTLDNAMHELDVPGDRADIINRVLATAYPRVTSPGVVVATIDAPFATPLATGETQVFFLPYTDPVQRDSKISATNGIAPAATTDYTMNAAADGSGADVTSSCTVVGEFLSTAVKLTVTNVSAPAAYVRTLQARGDALASLNPITAEAKDATSITDNGENLAELDMKYQADPYKAAGAAAYLLSLYRNPLANVRRVAFVANQSDALMVAAITGDISSRVLLKETVTGVVNTQAYFINGVEHAIDEQEMLTCTWWLTPADPAVYWALGVAGSSELGETTYLQGF